VGTKKIYNNRWQNICDNMAYDLFVRVPHTEYSRLLAIGHRFKPCLLFIGFHYVAKKPQKTINCI